jgi:two-component system response regulator YesN
LPPGIDGLEVLKRMKTLNNAAPVVFITGKGSEDVAVRAFRLGICDYISKPFKIMRLREIIKMNIFSKEINMPYVKKTFKFIETHYDQPISARDVSENVGISLSHLEHIFKKQVNNTITYYITSFRINEAK